MVDYQNPDHEQLMKRLRPAQSVEEVTVPLWGDLFMLGQNLSMLLRHQCTLY